MWNNNQSGFQVGFLGQDNARRLDNARGFDNAHGLHDNDSGFGFDNASRFADSANSKSFKQMHNSDHHFQCHQHYTGSRLEACLRGVPWEGRSGRSGKGGWC